MKLNGCYACGTATPELKMSNEGYKFRCTRCGFETKVKENIFDAQKDWNEGIVYLADDGDFWKIVFGKK